MEQRNPRKEHLRPYLERRFPAFKEAITRSLERELRALSPDETIMEIGYGDGYVAEALVPFITDKYYVGIDSTGISHARHMTQRFQNERMIFVGDSVTNHTDKAALIVLHNPDGILSHRQGAHKISELLSRSGELVILRDWDVDISTCRNANYFNDDLTPVDRARLEKQMTELSKAASERADYDPLLRDIFRRSDPYLQGHFLEEATIRDAYQKEGWECGMSEYIVIKTLSPIDESGTGFADLDKSYGYTDVYIGGYQNFFQDDTVAAGTIKRVYAMQKMKFHKNSQ